MTKHFYIVLGFVCMAVMISTAAGWTLQLERTIYPGDSVTIYCERMPENEAPYECDGLTAGGAPVGGCE